MAKKQADSAEISSEIQAKLRQFDSCRNTLSAIASVLNFTGDLSELPTVVGDLVEANRALRAQIAAHPAALSESVDPANDPLLSYSQLAKMFHRSPQTVRRWVLDGLLVSIAEPSGLRRVRQSVALQFLNAIPAKPGQETHGNSQLVGPG